MVPPTEHSIKVVYGTWQQLLPKLANGAISFLFAPDKKWLSRDPWVTAGAS